MTTKKSEAHKPEAHKKDDENLIHEGLQAIYGKEKIHFSKLERKKKSLTSILITIIIVLSSVGIISLATFFVYQKFFAQKADRYFTLDIETADTIISGERTSIRIHYANPTSAPIADLDIDVRLPPAFEVQNMLPMADDRDEMIWEIGSLSGHSDATIVIEGVWIADVPSETPVQAFANFRPGNFNAEFQEIETRYIKTERSTLELAITSDEDARPGEVVEYSIVAKNASEDIDLNNLEIELVLPDGFFIESSEPAIEPGRAPLWILETLPAGEEEEIAFKGTFAADREGFHYFNVNAFVRAQERRVKQAAAQGFTDVAKSELSVSLVANGANDKTNVRIGGNLRLSLAVENTGGSDITSNILIDFQSDKRVPIVWNSASLGGGRVTSAGIVFSNQSIAAGERKTYNLTLPIKDDLAAQDADVFNIVASAESSAMNVRSTPIEVSISTQAQFRASVRYYNDLGQALGSGSMPPHVGSTTTYRVFWRIENSLHDLENVEIEASLAPDVRFSGNIDTDLGTITENGGTIKWSIPSISKTATVVEGSFAISITPRNEHAGKFMKLLSGASMSATDATTKTAIQTTGESLDTELPNDPFAEGKGTVTP